MRAVRPPRKWMRVSPDGTLAGVRSGKFPPMAEGNPVWAHNGREIFYRSGDKMMAAEVVTECHERLQFGLFPS